MTTNIRRIARKSIAGFLAFTLAAMPMTQAAYGAITPLADQPIAAKVAAKPNLLYTFDDSGSMQLGYSPDFVIGNYCRHTNGTTIGACSTAYNNNRGMYEPLLTAEFNKLHYNPNINYDPPVDGNGNQASATSPGGAPAATVYKMMNATNTSNWTRVPNDMYTLAPASLPPPSATNTTNLAAQVPMWVFCNTDWPRAAYSGAIDATSWSEIGDANGEYSATAGKDCRINGIVYDALDSAPAVVADYNYPYNRSTGTVDDAKYFYRTAMITGSHQYRHLWCKTGAAGWPKTCTNTANCVNPPVVVTPPVAQTCVFTSNATTTGAPYTYAPVGCDANLLYQASGWTPSAAQVPFQCVGTIGVECLACTRTGTSVITGRNGACRLATTLTGGSGAGCNCSGVGCTLPACPNFDPPDICDAAGFVQSCVARSSANCNMTYGGTGGTGGTTLLDDANGAGVTCRHNNNTGSYISNRFTYPETKPSGSSTTTKWDKVVNDSSCGTIPRRVNIPNYYNTVATVRYCSTQNAINNDQWRGFGSSTCASPKTKNDFTTNKWPMYAPIVRTGLVSGRTYTYTDPFTGVSGTRSYAEEMTNFANWWTYYRTRVLAAKTTTANAFNIVDNTYRVGFHTMSSAMTNWVNSSDFNAAQRLAWYNKLFGVTIGTAKTPTLDAMIRIGQLVENGAGAVAGLPAHTDPIPTVNGNPVSCTNNYHILFTDGTTDQIALPTLVGEVDGSNVPAVSATTLPNGPAGIPERTVATLQTYAGAPWPRPYRDATPATANSLADIALDFWMRDLRPTLTNDVPSSDGSGGKDLDWRFDPAFWQHVSFSALSYGADGILDASNYVSVTNAIGAGSQQWFTTYFPTPPNNAQGPAGNPRMSAVDDLWHATVNARGKFVFAETPIEIAYGLGSIIAGVGNGSKARVGATFAKSKLSSSNNFFYKSSIDPGWSGDLKKVTIDTTSAAQLATRWSAATKLNTLLATPAPGTSPVNDFDNKWFLNRNIVTRNVDAGSFSVIPFRYANLNTGTNTQLNTLSSSTTQQQKLIAYLRGGSTFGAGPNPATIEGTAIGQFRLRSSKLGNISDSKPVVVGPAAYDYRDSSDYGYPAYKGTTASRSLRVYVGANDGMFHVFNGEDDSGIGTGGTETWAYMPSGVFTSAFDDGGKARKGIQALAYQDGGAPIFKHHFYVNAPPRYADVDFANCGSNSSCSPDWRTIVVSGMGKGGGTYFAIDATDPAVSNESQAAAKVLWEYALPYSDFSFSTPVIAKTRAYGWVVILASGYNNTKAGSDGKGHLYIMRASDGTLLRTLNTTGADSGSVASPSGLGQISGYVKNDNDQTLEQIYGGDLNGRLWRWDVSSPDPTTWQAQTVLFANLTDPSGVAQPITTAPEIEIDLNNGVDRFVFVGTGRLLDPTDLTTPSPEQIQTAYAIRDGTLETPTSTGLPIAPRSTMAAIAGVAGTGTAAPNGWYDDLPSGQRVVVNVVAEFNTFAYVGTELQPDPCLTSLPAYIYARDYVVGESVLFPGGTQVEFAFKPEGSVGLELVMLEDPTKSFPTLSLFPTPENLGDPVPVPIRPKAFSGGHRLSWRLLGD